MIRRFFYFLIFLIPVNCLAQQTDLVFESPVYDFGYIKESEGKVYHIFHFTNREKNPVSIEKVSSSCGCMVPIISSKTFQPGESGWIKVEYDPAGRPGKFIKSVEIETRSGNNTFTYYVNLRGVVLEKEVLPAYTEDWKYAVLQIKPFVATIISNTDYRFLNSKELQDFINDITYEIDQNYFSNLKLELYTRDGENHEEIADAIFLPVKKFIITELKRRNYSGNQVGFIENPGVKDNSVPAGSLAYLRISSMDYNNDSITESGFFPLDKFREQISDQLLNKKRAEDSLFFSGFVSGYVQVNSKKGIDVRNTGYESFIRQAVRQVLMYGKVYMRIDINSEVPSAKIESEKKRILKLIPSIMDQIKKDLEESGIDIAKAEFAVPAIDVSASEDPQMKITVFSFHPKVEMQKMTSEEILMGITDSSSIRRKKAGIVDPQFKPPFQDLPTLLQYTDASSPLLDIYNKDFLLWAGLLADELKENKQITFLVESCFSNSPFSKTDNNYISRQQARESQELLKKWLMEKGVNEEQIKFKEPVTLVQGPEYSSRNFKLSFYDKFNYIKIIPVYNTSEEKSFEVFPYQVNFNHNYFELPATSEVFQVFVNRLIPVIDQQGYARLIIESSASKVPVKNYSNNSALAFTRSEETKNQLREEIRKRGYDPRRLIITEQRSIVQGPDYNYEWDPGSSLYEKYQYIKIIPEQLIKEQD